MQLSSNLALDEATRHVLFHHHQTSGWVTLANKEKCGRWKQRHYQREQLHLEIPSWLAKSNDVFFSQNTFYKPQRKIENIRQLKALYVDIDCHNLNYDPHWVAEKLNLEVFQETLPTPNHIIYSGRGLVCIWLIEPVPHQALPLWQVVQTYFYEQLKYVGADKKSIDSTRVFRIAGSVNSKNGKPVNVEYRHDYRYSLRDLQTEYLPELSPFTSNTTPKVKRKTKITHIFNILNLHYTRLRDITKLAELRKYDLKGYRETICFLYRYWSCCFTEDPEVSLTQMIDFNNEFIEPLPIGELTRATKSAENAWKAKNNQQANEEARKKGYPGAGYNLTNQTIIQWLDITPEEQIHLKTIIDSEEKRRRKRERDKNAFRKKKGAISREVYLEQQTDKTEDMLWQLKTAIERHPRLSNVKLAKLLGVSESYIRKLKVNFDF